MAIQNFIFDSNHTKNTINLDISRRYKILTVRIIAGILNGLENSVHLTSLYFLKTLDNKFETITLSLDNITGFTGLDFMVEFPVDIVFDDAVIKATISLLPFILPPIISIEVSMEDFT